MSGFSAADIETRGQVSGGVFVLTRAVVQGDNFLVFQTLGSPDQETLIGDVHDRLIDSIEFQA